MPWLSGRGRGGQSSVTDTRHISAVVAFRSLSLFQPPHFGLVFLAVPVPTTLLVHQLLKHEDRRYLSSALRASAFASIDVNRERRAVMAASGSGRNQHQAPGFGLELDRQRGYFFVIHLAGPGRCACRPVSTAFRRPLLIARR